jgi:hypothetical protein
MLTAPRSPICALALTALLPVAACAPLVADDVDAALTGLFEELGVPCERVVDRRSLDESASAWHVTCAGAQAYVAFAGADGVACVEPVPTGDFSGIRGMVFVPPPRCSDGLHLR